MLTHLILLVLLTPVVFVETYKYGTPHYGILLIIL